MANVNNRRPDPGLGEDMEVVKSRHLGPVRLPPGTGSVVFGVERAGGDCTVL